MKAFEVSSNCKNITLKFIQIQPTEIIYNVVLAISTQLYKYREFKLQLIGGGDSRWRSFGRLKRLT